MMDSLLLIYIPIFGAIVLSLISFSVFKNVSLFVKAHSAWFAVMNLALYGFSLSIGGFAGLLIALQMNKQIFDYRILEPVLPNGIFMWYGFGPAPTPQFMNYWVYVQVACFILLMALIALSFQARKRRLRSKGA